MTFIWINVLIMITKTQLINTLSKLPEDLTVDQVIDHLIFVDKVQKGLDDAANGGPTPNRRLVIG